jgi:2',5'-phosphodiesterase
MFGNKLRLCSFPVRVAGGKVEFIDNMDLCHTLDLSSACGYPRYTNFVTGFCGCLDYIYVEPKLIRTLNVVPLPDHEEVTRFIALPNAVFPSDHIALVCDLSFVGSDDRPTKQPTK